MANSSSSTSLNREQDRTTRSSDRGYESTSVALALSSAELNALDNYRYFNVDHISVSPSPMKIQPRLFRPGMLFNSTIYERVFSSAYRPNSKTNAMDRSDEDDDDDDEQGTTSDDLHDVLYEARAEELDALAENAVTQRPSDDETTEFILNELGLRAGRVQTRTTMDRLDDDLGQDAPSSMSSARSYPPVHQTGPIDDHDRPFAEFGHLDRATLARQYDFNLQPPSTQQPPPARFHAKSFAILAYTHVPKEAIMANITEQFGMNSIQYICISEAVDPSSSQQSCLQIQLMFREKIDRRKPFLDDITGSRCNYQVTSNDLAWNEYIKKDGHYSEFGEFKSAKNHGRREWPSQSLPSAAASVSSAVPAPPVPTTRATATRPTTVRAQAEERRQRDDDLARQALALAETSVDQAMDLLRSVMPNKFLHHSKWYLDAFKYVHLRRQHEADLAGTIDKEYTWPDSFKDCTLGLRAAIERWIKHHFYRVKRAKCLVLIGPTGTGKTSFAMSLPGQVNYFQGRWNLDSWNDYARYSVYDDVPWDDFEKWNYPLMKSLLTQNGKLNVTDKYRTSMTINVRQPAIVLMNPENAGSLLAPPTTVAARQWAAYWRKRATVYVMDADEYFFKRQNQSQNSGSTNSSMSVNDQRLMDVD